MRALINNNNQSLIQTQIQIRGVLNIKILVRSIYLSMTVSSQIRMMRINGLMLWAKEKKVLDKETIADEARKRWWLSGQVARDYAKCVLIQMGVK